MKALILGGERSSLQGWQSCPGQWLGVTWLLNHLRAARARGGDREVVSPPRGWVGNRFIAPSCIFVWCPVHSAAGWGAAPCCLPAQPPAVCAPEQLLCWTASTCEATQPGRWWTTSSGPWALMRSLASTTSTTQTPACRGSPRPPPGTTRRS